MYHSLRLAKSRLASRALHFESVFVQRQRASLLLARLRECISVQSHVNQFRVTVAVTCKSGRSGVRNPIENDKSVHGRTHHSDYSRECTRRSMASMSDGYCWLGMDYSKSLKKNY